MATGDVPDLIRRYFDSDSPTELSRATGGRVTPQSADLLRKDKAKFLRLPSNATIMGLSDALGFGFDDAILRAFALSGGELRIRDADSLLVREIQSRVRSEAWDDYPRVVADMTRAMASQAQLLIDLRDQS